jgi:ketopantoate reductase
VSLVHAGWGDVTVGPAFADTTLTQDMIKQTVYELQTAADIPIKLVNHDRMRRVQWRKLAVNASINPVTALTNIPNGGLDTEQGHTIMRSICEEVRMLQITG